MGFRKNLNDFIAYSFVAICFISILAIVVLTYIFIFNYDKVNIAYPIPIYVGSVLLLILIPYLLFKSLRDEKPIPVASVIEPVNYAVIKVKADDISVTSRSYFNEKPRSEDHRGQAIDALLSSEKSVVRNRVDNSYIHCKIDYKGKKRTFKSSSIGKGETSIKLHLYQQKEIELYINENDPRDYYFDLKLS